MKSCPKCNRTFPDEGQKFCTFDGGLLIAQPAFDPNATIRATALDLEPTTTEPTEKSTSRELKDPNATVMESYAETIALPRNTGPTGANPTSTNFSTPQPPPPAPPSPTMVIANTPPVASAPLPSAPLTAPQPPVAAGKKKSKLPLILGILVVLLLLVGGGAAGLFFMVVKPWLNEQKARQNAPEPTPTVVAANSPQPTPSIETSPSPVNNFVPPDDAVEFTNSSSSLDGKLAEHYFDFSFYYPKSWKKDPKAGVAGATNFVGVERTVDNFPQETFSVGWYTSSGTFGGDSSSYPKRVEEFSSSLAKQFPEYRKVSEGPTTINSMQGYEFRWEALSRGTEKGDVSLWGRVVFLPTGNEGDTAGATLTMFSTSLADDLHGVGDVGVKGQMPVILESFRFGKR